VDPRGIGRALLSDAPDGLTINEQVQLPEHPIDGTEFSMQVMLEDVPVNVKDVAKLELYTTQNVGWGKTKRTFAAIRFGGQIIYQHSNNGWQVVVDKTETNRWYAIKIRFDAGMARIYIDGVEKFSVANPAASGHTVQAMALSGWDLRGLGYVDMIELASITPPQLQVSPGTLNFATVQAGPPSTANFTIAAADPLAQFDWTATVDVPWLLLSAAEGIGASTVAATAYPSDLEAGLYSGNITVSADIDGSPQTILVTMQVSAEGSITVQGTVRSEDGVPIPGAFVYCRTPARTEFEVDLGKAGTIADAAGHFSFNGAFCPQSGFTMLSAQRPKAIPQGTFEWEGMTEFVPTEGAYERDIYMARSGTLDLRLLDPAGNPVSTSFGVSVSPFQLWKLSGFTDATGHAIVSFPAEPDLHLNGDRSMLRVDASGQLNNPLRLFAHASVGPLVPGMVVPMTLQLKGDWPPGTVTIGNFSFNSDAALLGVNMNGPFLYVNGQPVEPLVAWQRNGNDLWFDTPLAYPLSARRHAHVSSDGVWARSIEEITNASGAPIEVTIKTRYSVSMAGLTVETSTGDETTDIDDNYLLLTSGNVVGSIVSRSSTPPIAPGLAEYVAPAMDHEWTVTVPANGRVLLMSFMVAQREGDAEAGRQLTKSLANLTAPGAVEGLSASDFADIINFDTSHCTEGVGSCAQ
jgi:hypothetical protein